MEIDIQIQSKPMSSELYQVVVSGNSEHLKELVRKTPEILLEVTCIKKNTVLHLAVNCRQKEIATVIVDSQPSLIYKKNEKEEEAPLHLAAKTGNTEVAEILLNAVTESQEAEAGQQLLRMENLNKDTALHLAAQYGHLEVVKMLLQKDPGLALSENEAGEGPLFRALDWKSEDVARYIINNALEYSHRGRDGRNVLHAAATLKFNDLLNAMMEKRPTTLVERCDNMGLTPLHCAAYGDNYEAICTMMGKNSTFAYLTNREGMTPLHVAAGRGNIGVLKKYIELCPDAFEQTDSKGRTALHIAVQSGEAKAGKFMLETPGLEDLLRERDEKGYTALRHANELYNCRIALMLKKKYKDIYGLNKDHCLQVWGINILCVILSTLSRKGNKFSYVSRTVEQLISSFNKKVKDRSSRKSGPIKEELKKRFGKIADRNILVGTLIATATLVAAVQVPGGCNDKGEPYLKDSVGYKIFYFAETTAFLLSILTIVIYFSSTYEIESKFSDSLLSMLLFSRSGVFTYCSAVAMVIAFWTGTAISQEGLTSDVSTSNQINLFNSFLLLAFSAIVMPFALQEMESAIE